MFQLEVQSSFLQSYLRLLVQRGVAEDHSQVILLAQILVLLVE